MQGLCRQPVGRYFAVMHTGKFVMAQLLDWIHP